MKVASVVLLVTGAMGCAPYLQATAGYASPLVEKGDGERGGALNVHAGLTVVDEGPIAVAMGVNARSRFTERAQVVGLGQEATLRYLMHRHPVEPTWRPCPAPAEEGCRTAEYPSLLPMELYGRIGTSLVTLGAHDGAATIGLTPFLEYGLAVMIDGEDVPYLTLGNALSYDVRLAGEQGPLTVSFLLGVGLLKVRRPGTGGGLPFLR